MAPNKITHQVGVLFNFMLVCNVAIIILTPITLRTDVENVSEEAICSVSYIANTMHILSSVSALFPQMHYIAQPHALCTEQVHSCAIQRDMRRMFCYGGGRHYFGR